MNEQDLKLQAYFDGELPAAEAREVNELLQRDSQAAALLHTLEATREGLSGFENGVKVPETREFYWSKIRREIERLEPRPEPARPAFFARLQRFLVPAAGVALVLAAGLIASRDLRKTTPAEFETADSKAFTYRDYSSGTTLVWLSYPADQDAEDDSLSLLD